MGLKEQTAASLLEIGAVGFKPKEPLTFKSGMISPVYVDNRRFPNYPEHWKPVIKGFAALIKDQNIEFDMVAGIETAGIPHSAALGYELEKPSVFVRKAVKDHGTKKRVEGGDVQGKRVLLIEDHVTTGGSSLSGVEALRAEGAVVKYCLAITSYEFAAAAEAFAAAQVQLLTLTNFATILSVAEDKGALAAAERSIIEDWLADPQGWGARNGFGTSKE